MQRLFPEIKIPNSEQWMPSTEKLIKKHISSLQNTIVVPSDHSKEVTKLQAQLEHYRVIIVDTVSIYHITKCNSVQVLYVILGKHVEQPPETCRSRRKELEGDIIGKR